MKRDGPLHFGSNPLKDQEEAVFFVYTRETFDRSAFQNQQKREALSKSSISCQNVYNGRKKRAEEKHSTGSYSTCLQVRSKVCPGDDGGDLCSCETAFHANTGMHSVLPNDKICGTAFY